MTDDSRQLPVIQPGRSPGLPPIFHKIGVVGLGLIGGSIALAARQLWPTALVIGVDRKDVLEKAMVLHAIDVAADDLIVLAEADLVILAAPIQQNLSLLRELPENVTGSAIVTDTGSTKRAMVEAARSLPARLTFIGGHPLGGAAASGIEHARADLFSGRPWLFTPETPAGDDPGGPIFSGAGPHPRVGPIGPLERLVEFVTAMGAVPRTRTPADHDRLLAFISHLPQLSVSALMHVVGNAARQEGLQLSGRGLVDTTRLASSPAGIWKEVCATNADEIAAALDALIAVLQDLRQNLETGQAVDRIFQSANAWRETLLAERS
jgi:prephenate dehydrogenase